jgi:hypothetical protein
VARVRGGYEVKSFDFTENIYALFKGPGALAFTTQFCIENKLVILSAEKQEKDKA